MSTTELSRDMINEICMMMRVCDLFKDNAAGIDEVPGMKETVAEFNRLLKEIWDTLSDEQRDVVLQEHKAQIAVIREEQALKKKTEAE
jgi:hypothetical protein